MTDPGLRPHIPPPPLGEPIDPKSVSELYAALTAAKFHYIDITLPNGDGAAGILIGVTSHEEDSFVTVDLDYGYSFDVNLFTQIKTSEVRFELVRADAPELFESLNEAARVTAAAYLAAIEEVATRRAESISMASARGAINAILAALNGETSPDKLGIHPQSAWGIHLAVIRGARPA